MASKKEKEEFVLTVVLAAGKTLTSQPMSKADAQEAARTAIVDGYEYEDVFYPVHQITRAKVSPANVQ